MVYAAGSKYNSTQICSTKAALMTFVQNGLLAADWVGISGLSTSDVVLKSGSNPPPQSLYCRVRLENGSDPEIKVYFGNSDGSLWSSPYYILPDASNQYHLIANRHHLFLFTNNCNTLPSRYVAGGTVYKPVFIQSAINECVWSQGTAIHTAGTQLYYGFAKRTHTQNRNNSCPQWNLVNNVAWERRFENPSLSTQDLGGLQSLLVQSSPVLNMWNYGMRWHDDSVQFYDAVIGWGLTGETDELKWRGILYDAAVIGNNYVMGTTTDIDSRRWFVITDDNEGGTGGVSSEMNAKSSLALAIP